MSMFNIVLGVLVGLLSLVCLIVAHEFGHFIMARKNGVRVKEFGIGFPPRAKAWIVKKSKKRRLGLWKKWPKRNWPKEANAASTAVIDNPSQEVANSDNLIVSLNYLPLGGFCAMDGESDDDVRPGTFGAASYWAKTKILFAGVLANWLIAFVILTILAWTGLPSLIEHQFTISADETVKLKTPVAVAEITPDSPAEHSALSVDDLILEASADGAVVKILTTQDLLDFNAAHAGQTVIYTINHPVKINDTQFCPERSYCLDSTKSKTVYRTSEVELTLNQANSEDVPLLGAKLIPSVTYARYTWSAPLVGAGLTAQFTATVYQGLGQTLANLISGAARQISLSAETRAQGQEQVSEAANGVSGIVGILGTYFPQLISAGPSYTFLFIAFISISLACMNILPIPALDGGRWLMITIARLRRRRLSKEVEQKIVARAFIVLLALMFLITVLDVVHLINH